LQEVSWPFLILKSPISVLLINTSQKWNVGIRARSARVRAEWTHETDLLFLVALFHSGSHPGQALGLFTVSLSLWHLMSLWSSTTVPQRLVYGWVPHPQTISETTAPTR
jgi:hypothetical protein